MNMCTKVQVDMLKKTDEMSSAVLNAQKGHFYAIYEDFGNFTILKFKAFYDHF